MTTEDSGWREGTLVVLGLALLLLAVFPYFEAVRNANEIPRLLQAMSVAEAGEWAIDGPSRRGIAVGPDVARSPADGRLYPNKPPGATVVGVLAFRLAQLGAQAPTLREFTWWARLLAGVVPVLVVAGVGWRRLGRDFDRPTATAAVLLLCLGTPLFVYGRLFYGHALAAALLYAGVLALERGVSTRERSPAWMWAGLGGLSASAAITVEYGAAFAGLPIAVALLVALARDWRQQGPTVAAAVVAALGPVALLAAYQAAVYGSPWATGYHHAANEGFAELHGQGLLGLGLPRWENVEIHLLSPSTGLLVWSPLALLGALGLAWGSAVGEAQARAACRLRLAIFLVIALMGLGLSFQGGWRVGPRYLVVALPMLARGLAVLVAGLRGLSNSQGASLAVGLAVFGLATVAGESLLANALAANLWPHLDATNIGEPFGEVLLPLWRGGAKPYGLPQLFPGGMAAAIVGPVFVGFAVLGRALLGRIGASATVAGRPSRSASALVVLAIVLGGVVANLALTVSLPAMVEDAPLSERNLRYIRSVYEPVGEWQGERRDASVELTPLGAPR